MLHNMLHMRTCYMLTRIRRFSFLQQNHHHHGTTITTSLQFRKFAVKFGVPSNKATFTSFKAFTAYKASVIIFLSIGRRRQI